MEQNMLVYMSSQNNALEDGKLVTQSCVELTRQNSPLLLCH
jgi:hypothetical protein